MREAESVCVCVYSEDLVCVFVCTGVSVGSVNMQQMPRTCRDSGLFHAAGEQCAASSSSSSFSVSVGFQIKFLDDLVKISTVASGTPVKAAWAQQLQCAEGMTDTHYHVSFSSETVNSQ